MFNVLKQTNGSLIHDGIRATECFWSDGAEMWLFLKLFLQTSSFEPQHKVLLISDEIIYCNDKLRPLKLLFPHLWEWGAFNVTYIYNSFTPANSLYSRSIIFAVQKISPSSYDDYSKKKESDNSVSKNKMCGHAHNLKSWSTYDDFCQGCSVFYHSFVSSSFDFFIPKNSDILMGKKVKILCYL